MGVTPPIIDEMTPSLFPEGRSKVPRILPITLDQQTENTDAPIGYHSRLFNPTSNTR